MDTPLITNAPDRTASIDEAMIERLVRVFYERARLDPLIGPIFAAKVHDWDRHIRQICDFWSSIMCKTGRYHGRPMAAHMPLPVERIHFDRWLEIFDRTASELCPAEAARLCLDRAYRIAESLELGVSTLYSRIEPVQKRKPSAAPASGLSAN